MKWVHILDCIDPKEKTAKCKKCGFVKIINKEKLPKVRWRCLNASQRNLLEGFYKFKLPDKILKFGICPICLKEKKLEIDHCHTEQKFRDFICHRCNVVLGWVHDDISLLESLITYLKK